VYPSKTFGGPPGPGYELFTKGVMYSFLGREGLNSRNGVKLGKHACGSYLNGTKWRLMPLLSDVVRSLETRRMQRDSDVMRPTHAIAWMCGHRPSDARVAPS